MPNVYFVSGQHGNNSNNGLSAGTAFATLAKLQSVMTGVGDSAWIGPSTYRERYTFQANNQTVTADPTCLHLTSDTPGRVRITGAGTDEKPTSGAIISTNSKTGCAVNGYSADAMLLVDGSSDNYGISGTAITSTTAQYVSVTGMHGFTLLTATNCLAIVMGGQGNGYLNCAADTCTVLGGTNGFYASSGVASTSVWRNCQAIGVTMYAFRGLSTTYQAIARNCLAMCAAYGFQGDARGLAIDHSAAYLCGNGSYGVNLTYPLDISTFNYCQCSTPNRGGGYDTGSSTAVGQILFDSGVLLRALEPILLTGIFGLGTATGAPATDIFGRALKSPPDIGPYSEAENPRTVMSGIGRGRTVNR